MTYGAETWTLTKKVVRRHKVAQQAIESDVRGVFPWKSSSSTKSQDSSVGSSWRLFSSKSTCNLDKNHTTEVQKSLTPASSAANTPHHHKRQGSSASEKQFDDLVASSIALIQHDRPSNLPAKCTEEALRHKAEHARMVEAARRRVEREAAARHARLQESLRMEERLARHAREWTQNILPDWSNIHAVVRIFFNMGLIRRLRITQRAMERAMLGVSLRDQKCGDSWKNQSYRHSSTSREAEVAMDRAHCSDKGWTLGSQGAGIAAPNWKNSKRTLELWWSGLPPAIRGRVWQLAIENKLKISHDNYQDYVTKAKQKLHEAQLRRKRLKINSKNTCNCKKEDKIEDQKVDDRLSADEFARTDERSSKRSSKTDDSNEKSDKRLGLPRNFSEQNLKTLTVDPPKKCCSKSNPNLLDYSDECSMELIQLDIARTFPHLCIFQPGGPYFDVLHELLAAYVCYRPDVGYIQGMSFIAAVLILNMEAPQAFVCFANLLDGPVLRAAFTRDGDTMQRLWKAYGTLLHHNLPSLADVLAPELYLLEWLYTAFAKAMPLDAACRVWDVFLRDGDTFLFNTAL
ncbi:jg4908, partial [Pararge aegeria aegeria]